MISKAKKLNLLLYVLASRFSRAPKPIIASLLITEQCNLSCAYCKIEENHRLSKNEIFTIMDRLAKVGTKVLILTGGEPFIRNDIHEIIDYSNKSGFILKINTNGAYLKKKRNLLTKIDGLTISLDAPKPIHDLIRGQGAHDQALEGIKTAFTHKIKLNLAAVLSKHTTNTECIEYLLDIGKKYKSFVTFQPASRELLRAEGLNPITPEIEQYRIMIDYLIEQKKKKRNVSNSLTGLKYLRDWPSLKPLSCAGHSTYRRITNTGNIQICGIVQESFGNIFDEDYKHKFKKSNKRICDKCWCEARVELNLTMSGNLDAVKNMFLKYNRFI